MRSRRTGAGGIPSRFRIRRIVEAPTGLPEAVQLAVDALVAPAGIVPRHLLHQHGYLRVDRWTAGSVRVSPMAGDQAPMPAQDRCRGDVPPHRQRPGAEA